MTDIERGMMMLLAKEVRADPILREMIDLMPLSDEGREAVWTLAICAYVKGHLAGSKC